MRVQQWLCALVFLLCTTPAWAAPIAYTDRAAFDAAVGDYTLLTLEPDPGTGSCPPGPCTPTYGGGLVFTQVDYNNGCGWFGFICFGVYDVTMVVTQPVTAFGFEVSNGDGFAGGTGSLFPVPFEIFPVSQGQFYGWVSPTPFTVGFSKVFEPEGGGWLMDNLAIKTVPEPSTLLLLGSGLAGLVMWRSRQRKAGTT